MSGTPASASTRVDIMRAGAEVLAERGYHGCSLREIADVVGLQSASLYHHFDSKQQLLTEVMRAALEDLSARVRTAVEAASGPIEQLSAAIAKHVEFEGLHPAEAIVCREELRALDGDARARILAMRDSYEDMLTDILDRGVGEGLFTVQHSRLTVRALVAMWNGVSAWYRPDGRLSLEEIATVYTNLALAALHAPGAPGPPLEIERRAPASDASVRIREAAVRLFAERGYYGTSLRELAEAADMPASNVYYYYASKAAVLFSIMEGTMLELLAQVRLAVSQQADPVRQLEAAVAAHVRFHANRRDEAFVADAEFRALEPDGLGAVERLRQEYENVFASILRNGLAAGVFHLDDVNTTVYGMIRMCTSVATWFDPNGGQSLDDVAAHYSQLSLAAVGCDV